jgi:hypothetical protein
MREMYGASGVHFFKAMPTEALSADVEEGVCA